MNWLDAIDEAFKQDVEGRPFKPQWFQPGIGAAGWRTMDEDLFRAFMSKGKRLIVSKASHDAIMERRRALGMKDDK